MGMGREILERQLAVAQQLRDQTVKSLSDAGKSETQFRFDAQWRQRDANCRKLTRRLGRVGEKENTGAVDVDDE